MTQELCHQWFSRFPNDTGSKVTLFLKVPAISYSHKANLCLTDLGTEMYEQNLKTFCY